MRSNKMSLKDAVKKYPVLFEFLPVDLIDCPDYMCSVYYDNGKRHFKIYDTRDPYTVSRVD